MRHLATQLGLELKDSADVEGKLQEAAARNADAAIRPAEGIAEPIAYAGEWQWALARSIERGHKLAIYAYATRQGGQWRIDMHVGRQAEPPLFGWDVPHIYIPVSEIFAFVYTGCKKLLGIIAQAHD